MWKPGDVLVNKHYSVYMVREGDPFRYDLNGVRIPDPPGFHRIPATDYTGLTHLGSLSAEHWYKVNVFWWWLRVASHRLNYWDLKFHKSAKVGNPSWYLRWIFCIFYFMIFFMPEAPEKGPYFKRLVAKYQHKHQVKKAKLAESYGY